MDIRRELSLHEIVVGVIFLITNIMMFFCSSSSISSSNMRLLLFAENIELFLHCSSRCCLSRQFADESGLGQSEDRVLAELLGQSAQEWL